MSADPIFHHWIKFSFDEIELISHNENGYTAASNANHHIVVWQNHQIGPNLSEGQLVCIITDQFDRIDQLQWVVNTDFLLIKSGERIRIWNIFTNLQEAAYFSLEPILYCKAISLGFLVVNVSGRFNLYTKSNKITSVVQSDLIMDIPEGVIVYPNRFEVVDGEWIENELGMSWGERGIRRNFEGINEIQIDGDLVLIGEEREEPDYTIPDGYRHVFDGCGILIIIAIPDGYLIRTRKNVLILNRGPVDDGILIPENAQIIPSNNHPYFITRTQQQDERILWKSGHLIREPVISELKNVDNQLKNVPPYLYLDFDQDLQYVRFNVDYGFIWYPDYLADYVFIDLFTQEGSIFTDIGRYNHDYIQVAPAGDRLYQWQRGKNYPSGKLLYYDIEHPDQDPAVLYDEQVSTIRINSEQFHDDSFDAINFPLIIPSWHRLNLFVFTGELQFSQSLSYSQYYILLDRLSQSDNAAILEYPEEIPEDVDYIAFGNLFLELDERTVGFENISPEWAFHDKTGLLAYFTIDQHCYVINTFDPYLLPIYSFQTNLPYQIEFSPNGLYLLYLSFDIRETKFSTHPNDGYRDFISTDFPYLCIEVHNIGLQQSYHRAVRFPLRLEIDSVEVVFEDQHLLIYIPSYTNTSEELVVMFDFQSKSFHQVNGASQNRFWMSYSKNSPHNIANSGEEFPKTAHPEISRDYTLRPFELFEGVIVRKEDQVPISMGDVAIEQVAQQSTADLYSLEDTIEISVPFYYSERMKPIYIDTAKTNNRGIKRLVTLSRVEQLPDRLRFGLDNLPSRVSILKRMLQFIEKQLELNIVHSKNGLAFNHPQFEKYKQKILQEIEQSKLQKYR